MNYFILRQGPFVAIHRCFIYFSDVKWNRLGDMVNFILYLMCMDPYSETFANKRFRILMHVVFWIAVSVFYTFFFGHRSGSYTRMLLLVAPLMLVTISTAYFINYYLVPRYLFQGKFWKLILYASYTFVVSVWLETLVITSLVIVLVWHDGSLPDQTALDLMFLVVAMYFIILVAVSVKLFKSWYEKQHALRQVDHAKVQAELQLLKSQIHPHFLFNTLNNIYALSLKKSDAAPEMILRLSAMLDYLLYECNAPLVSLEKEINLLQNYIALEEIRYADRLDISFLNEGDLKNVEVAPLILLPFVENSFKHGAGSKRGKVMVKIALSVKNKSLSFSVENNKSRSEKKSDHGGIGLANVKKRLDLLYPGKYRLDLIDADDTFSVYLKIELT